MTTTTLTKNERFVLEWLAKEDDSLYGEARGKAYDALLELGLVEVCYRDRRGEDYNRVRLTEAGFAYLKDA